MALTLTNVLNTGVLALALSAGLSYAADRNPTGEKATFKIDTTGDRTVGLVNGGTFVMTVGEAVSATAAYTIKLDYNVDLSIIGTKSGNQDLNAPAAYFTSNFMSDLRTSKHFESTQFKVDYLGTEDVTTMDGTSYPGADKVRIYDIKIDVASPMYNMVSLLATSANFAAGPSPVPANTQLIADVVSGVPVLGAVRIDLSGSELGITLKVGADYQAQ